MSERTAAEVIEAFHLNVARAITAGRADWCVLKGGANLRYFFRNPRSSNDIDFDVVGRAARHVEAAVDKAIEGRGLGALLRQQGIEIVEVSKPKQTATTQRWTVAITATGHSGPVRTTIEFSSRARDVVSEDHQIETVPDEVVEPYGLAPPSLHHYRAAPAIDQKIDALAHRSETKARDVFDLDHLFRHQRHAGTPISSTLAGTTVSSAAVRATELPFSSFTTEVAPFLDQEFADLVDASAWSTLCSGVARTLDHLVAPSDHPCE